MQKILRQSSVVILAFGLILSGTLIAAKNQDDNGQIKDMLAVDYTMAVQNTSAWGGDHGHMFHVNGTWALAIRTYSIKLFYDITKIEIATVTLQGCVGQNPFSFLWNNNKTTGFITATVVKSEGIPAGKGMLFTVIINISDGASAGKTPLTLADGPDTYYRDTNGILRVPATIDGTVDIQTGNRPPGQPTIIGPIVGGSEVELNMSAMTIDPDGDQVYYNFSWGDGNYSGWLGPGESAALFTTNYTWWEDGLYPLMVKAKDTSDGESDWSAPHNITIARQIGFKNIQPGFVYIQLFTFNRSYFYINLFALLGATVFLTTHDLLIETIASEAVKKVRFEALNPLWGDLWIAEDDNSSNGFSSVLNLTLGLYQLTLTAYDANGNLIDNQVYPYCLFLRLGAGGSSGPQMGILRHHMRPSPSRL